MARGLLLAQSTVSHLSLPETALALRYHLSLGGRYSTHLYSGPPWVGQTMLSLGRIKTISPQYVLPAMLL